MPPGGAGSTTYGKGVFAMKYVFHYLNKQVEFLSQESPEKIVEISLALRDLFLPNNKKLSGFQVWLHDGALIPVYGVKEGQNTLLLSDLITHEQSEVDNTPDLGEAILNNYQKWSKEIEVIAKQNFRRKDDTSRFETLTRRTKLVLQAVQDIERIGIRDINVQAIFKYLSGQQRPSVLTVTQTLNISKSAFYRHQEILLKVLGDWILEHLSGDEIDELLSE